MTTLTPQGIIGALNSIELMKTDLNIQLVNREQELRELELYREIQDIKQSINELDKQEKEIKETGKQILLTNGLKKFQALDGTIIQLNSTAGVLVIEDESKIPKEYIKEKITTSIDKKTLKEDIKQGLIIEGVSIEKDYNLVIKN